MKYRKSIIALVVAVAFCSTAHATRQRPDKVIYDGKEYSLLPNNTEPTWRAFPATDFPMQQYFEKYPDKCPRSNVAETALARGHWATYEVRNGQLFLKEIEIYHYLSESDEVITKSVMHEVLPDKKPLKIDWLSGTFALREQDGREVIRLKINKGDVKEIEPPKSPDPSK